MAIENLMVALKATREIAMAWHSQELSQPRNEGSSTSSSLPHVASLACSDVYQDDAYEGLCRNELKVEASSFAPYIHRNPVFVHAPMSEDHVSLTNISFYITFNLGLAHHLKALKDEHDGEVTRSFDAAKALYGLALRIQNRKSEGDPILVAALLNNLSVVHGVLNNRSEMRLYEELLLSALVLMVDHAGQESAFITHKRSLSSIYGFMGNVLHLMIAESQVASAA